MLMSSWTRNNGDLSFSYSFFLTSELWELSISQVLLPWRQTWIGNTIIVKKRNQFWHRWPLQYMDWTKTKTAMQARGNLCFCKMRIQDACTYSTNACVATDSPHCSKVCTGGNWKGGGDFFRWRLLRGWWYSSVKSNCSISLETFFYKDGKATSVMSTLL